MKLWLFFRQHGFTLQSILNDICRFQGWFKTLFTALWNFFIGGLYYFKSLVALFLPEWNKILSLNNWVIIRYLLFGNIIENKKILMLPEETLLESCLSNFCTFITLLRFHRLVYSGFISVFHLLLNLLKLIFERIWSRKFFKINHTPPLSTWLNISVYKVRQYRGEKISEWYVAILVLVKPSAKSFYISVRNHFFWSITNQKTLDLSFVNFSLVLSIHGLE